MTTVASSPQAPLFRTVAVEAAAGSLGGASDLSPPSWTLLSLFLTASIIALATTAATMSYARKEIALGWLAPEGGAARVISPRPGVLADLAVAEGERVGAGQALFAVDSRHVLGVTTLDAELHAALERQSVLLNEQMATEGARATAEAAHLAVRITGLEAEERALAAQRALQVERAAVTGERLRAVSELRGRGLISETEYRAREEAWLGQRQAVALLDQQIAARRHEREQAQAQRALLQAEAADRLARLRSAAAELRQRVAEVAARGVQAVTAPIAGRVTALMAAPGQPVEPSRPVLTLMPEGALLRAELYVPTRAAGFVARGQRVRLMYDAFPYQRFGTYWGTIETVSAAVLGPEDVRGPVRPREPSYRVTALLDRTSVDAFGREVALQPEMGVRADIVLERRSLAAWAAAPLLAAWGRR